MRIVIPTTNEDCPAVHALSREGILFEAIVMQDDLHYSRLWTELWKAQEEFINIEHDVVPWPGAIYKLMYCQMSHWCAHMYPPAPGTMFHALGIIRIGATIMVNCPDLYKKWEGVPWNRLDGAVHSSLYHAGWQPDIHEPPVAHVKK